MKTNTLAVTTAIAALVVGAGCVPSGTWYADNDGDGFGDPAVSTTAASQPTGYVANNTDCDDTQTTMYPGNPEIDDGLDNDCDGTVAEIRIDEITFTDQTLAGCVLGAASDVSIEYAHDLRTLSCENLGIQSTDGIEHLTGLTWLDLNNNQIPAINISSLAVLEILLLHFNELTDIDISNNPALRQLTLHDNVMGSIDLSSNTNLTHLHAWNASLTTIDVSNNTALLELHISQNQLHSLNVDANVALTTLDASTNQLTTINFDNNALLDSTDLRNNPLLYATTQYLDGLAIATLLYDPVIAKTMFVTSTSYNGNLGGLSGADAKCQARAEAGNLPSGTYKAWLSDSSISAFDRMYHSVNSYVRPDGEVIAFGWDDLVDGVLLSTPNINEYGAETNDNVWTNTWYSGAIWSDAYSCANWQSDTSSFWGAVGNSSEARTGMWSYSNARHQCQLLNRLFCVEQ